MAGSEEKGRVEWIDPSKRLTFDRVTRIVTDYFGDAAAVVGTDNDRIIVRLASKSSPVMLPAVPDHPMRRLDLRVTDEGVAITAASKDEFTAALAHGLAALIRWARDAEAK